MLNGESHSRQGRPFGRARAKIVMYTERANGWEGTVGLIGGGRSLPPCPSFSWACDQRCLAQHQEERHETRRPTAP